ncbi:MAG: O-antigen ligase family protein [Prosthecobacter sp.]|uniref:O-antigen ligase family protein n=1 Tax=Prosthecobacter sp. TaxID=1965333 RepID=UPI003BB03B20
MDFICACLLVFFWYVRPQDIFAVISGVSVVKYAMYVGIIATVRRAGGFSRAIVWAVPMDWLVTAYCVWAIYATADHTGAFKEVFTYFSFHMVTALALNSWAKIEKYLNIWLGCLAVLAVLAVSSHWDVELVKGSAELTMAFHDRLTLNTWVFRNPNALGHGVVTLIPAALAWWVMAGGKNKMLGIALIALAIHCVLLTESKGAFLAGAGGLTMLFLFKRPVWLQLVLLALVYGLGIAALKSLPRMDTLSKDDEGIQGRMIVWQQAKFSMESTVTGEGLKTFQGYVSIRDSKLHRTVYIQIATHGSYVRHGADLGYMGLLLFAGIFYGGVRVLLVAQSVPGSEAMRVQRTLYALIATTVFSCWVVDRAYHMDFFLLSGVISAFHRRFLPGNKGQEEDGGKTEALGGAESTPLELSATAGGAPADEQRSEALAGTRRQETEDEEETAENTPDQFGAINLNWSRIGVVDMMIMYVILEVLLYFWELFSTDFVVF